MNEYYYYVILCRYIDRRDRVICTRRDRHLIAHRIPRRSALMASIYVHMGTPCYRYCICRYFSDEDLISCICSECLIPLLGVGIIHYESCVSLVIIEINMIYE